MADQNAILTALGLDTSQYEQGINKATQATQAFVQIGNDLDQLIRKIPIIGTAWELTGGKIVDAIADMRTSARDFNRVINTDTAGSLNATIEKLSEVQRQIKALKDFDLSRSIAETFSDPMGAIDSLNGGPGTIGYQERMARLNELEKVRREGLKETISLFNDRAQAESTAYSESEKQSRLLKVEEEQRNKIAELTASQDERFGPDRKGTPRENEANDYLQQRVQIINAQADAEKSLIEQQDLNRKNELSYEVSSAINRDHFLEVDQALLDVKKAQYELDSAAIAGSREQLDIAIKNAAVANQNLETAKRAQEIKERSARDDADLSRKRLTGTENEANLQSIKNRYGPSIREALYRGDNDVAESLASQAADDLSAEQTRNRLQGAYGRATERRSSRFRARQDRINKANDRVKNEAEKARNSPFGGAPNTGPGTGLDQDIGDRSDRSFKDFKNTKTPNRGGSGSDASSNKDAAKPTVRVEGLDDKLQKIQQSLDGGNK